MIILRCVIILAVVLSCVSAHSAQVWRKDHDRGTYVVLEGEIVEGDYAKIHKLLEELGPEQASTVVLRSPGGNYLEAIKIGTLLRKLNVGANIPSAGASGPVCPAEEPFPPPRDPRNCTCLSSCAFIFIGAPHRSGEFLGLHRPHYKPENFSRLSPDEASTKYRKLMRSSEAYLKDMGVSNRVHELIMSSPSDRMAVLDREYIRKFMWGWIPELDEWILAKCPGMPKAQKALKERLQKKAETEISEAEQLMLRELADAEMKVQQCRATAARELRRSGFRTVYGLRGGDSGTRDAPQER